MNNTFLFQNIPDTEIVTILKHLDARKVNFKKGMTILSNLNNSNEIGIVNSGKVLLVRVDYNGERTIVSEFKKNDIFGGCFSSYKNEELSIVADINSEIVFIEYNNIFKKNSKIFKWRETIIENMINILVNKINLDNIRIEILTKKSIREKLLEYFHSLEKDQKSNKIVLNYNYTKLSEYLSVDRSAMMRELKNLKDDGIIQIKNRVITLIYQ